MITYLKLTNFQKHEDLELRFTAGLQVIRGNNENGKSTLFRAIAYAFWGSRALPMSLDETVTWGKATSSLRVVLEFMHDNVTYKITRSKSGAELSSSTGVTASGHAEVTMFAEKLFGASAAVAQATMLTKQKDLETGLGSSAMSLIEKLSNMGLIDELVSAIQENLPSGSTKLLQSQIAAMATDEPVLDLKDLPELQRQADLAVGEWQAEVQGLAAQIAELAPLAESYSKKTTFNSQAAANQASLEARLAACTEPKAPTIPELTQEAFQAAVKQNAEYADRVAAWNTYQDFLSINQTHNRYSASEDSFVSNLKIAEAEVFALQSQLNKIDKDKAVTRATLVTEAACGLCGKDLSDVPEVQTKNAAANSKLEALSLEEELLRVKRLKHTEQVNFNVTLLSESKVFRDKFRRFSQATFDENTTPPTAVWSVEVPVQPEQPNTDLKTAKEVVKLWQNYRQACSNIVSQKDAYQAALADTVFQEVSAEEIAANQTYSAVLSRHRAAKDSLEATENLSRQHANKIDTLKAVHTSATAEWQRQQQARQDLLRELAKAEFNNSVISRLREARPVVAKRLWSLVLSGVSYYFSAIRGVSSTVSRSDNGFLIDGKPVDAFSGSTKDTLGLANRLVLQKTFLPTVGFMLVDEPGAAFDDTRESELLGVLASCGLSQVILVTHSDLADSFATGVIQI